MYLYLPLSLLQELNSDLLQVLEVEYLSVNQLACKVLSVKQGRRELSSPPLCHAKTKMS